MSRGSLATPPPRECIQTLLAVAQQQARRLKGISMWPNPTRQPQQHKHQDIRALAQVKQTPSKATHIHDMVAQCIFLTLYLAFLVEGLSFFLKDQKKSLGTMGACVLQTLGWKIAGVDLGPPKGVQGGQRVVFRVFFPKDKGDSREGFKPKKTQISHPKRCLF